jgi:hypothetical protein
MEKPTIKFTFDLTSAVVIAFCGMSFLLLFWQPERGSIGGAYVCQHDPEYCDQLEDHPNDQ